MKYKDNSKKAQEGYSDVSYEDTWSVDETLANIIAKHLWAFLKASSDCLKIIDLFYEESAETWERIRTRA